MSLSEKRNKLFYILLICLIWLVLLGCASSISIKNIRQPDIASEKMDTDELIFMTFNIRAGGGMENYGMSPRLVKAPKENLSKLASAIKSVDPDIAGLQEVRGYDQAKFIADQLNMNFAYVTHGRASWWGLAILSKFNILDITTNNINYGDDNRVGLLSTFEINGKIIKVFNLHYALENYHRQAKASMILLEDENVPFVLMGDLNRQYFDPELDPIKEKLIDTCYASKTNRPNKPCGAETFGGWLMPEGVPVNGKRIDYIFLYPNSFYVIDVGITSNEFFYVSDHRAYWAKVKLKD